MADDHEERLRQHEDILRSFTAMLVAQREMNERVTGFMQRQDAINERLTTAIENLGTTQTRIETLLAVRRCAVKAAGKNVRKHLGYTGIR